MKQTEWAFFYNGGKINFPVIWSDKRNDRRMLKCQTIWWANQVVVVILSFALVWFSSAARAMDAAARRRMAAFRRLQEDKLALVIMIMVWRLLLVRVRQKRSLWMRPKSQAFLGAASDMDMCDVILGKCTRIICNVSSLWLPILRSLLHFRKQ